MGGRGEGGDNMLVDKWRSNVNIFVVILAVIRIKALSL